MRSTIGRRTVISTALALGLLGLAAVPAALGQAQPTQAPPRATPAATTPATTPAAPPQQRVVPKRPAPVAVEPRTVEAGRVSPNDLAKGQFTLTNLTGSTLEIDRVQITCNCTRAAPQAMSIPPRGSIIVDMHIDLRGDIGPFEKQAHVHFKGFPEPATLRLIGDFQFGVSAEPSRLRVDAQNRTGQFELLSLDGKPFKVLSVHGQTPTIIAQTPSEGDRVTRCTVAYDLRNVSLVPAAMVVITDHPDARIMPLRVLGWDTAQQEQPFTRTLQELAFSRKFMNVGVLKPGVPVDFDMTVFREVQNHGVPLSAHFGRDDVKVEVIELGPEPNASMFPKAQRVVFRVTSNIETPGTMFLTPFYMTFQVAGGPKIEQRIWAAGLTEGEHVPAPAPGSAPIGKAAAQ